MLEIGFIHMAASIMSADMLHTVVTDCENYKKEKQTVSELIDARYDISEVDSRSLEILAKLIKCAIAAWWQRSRYSAQLDAMMAEIMSVVATRVVVVSRGRCSLVIEDLTADEIDALNEYVKKEYPSLIFYCERYNPESIGCKI